MKTIIALVFVNMLVACGTDEGGHAVNYMPSCCGGKTAANPNSLLMCKVDASEEVSSVFVEKDEDGMIQTLKEMEYSICQ